MRQSRTSSGIWSFSRVALSARFFLQSRITPPMVPLLLSLVFAPLRPDMPGISLPLKPRSFRRNKAARCLVAHSVSRVPRFWQLIVYATWAAFRATTTHMARTFSPFYSPEIWGNTEHAWFRPAANVVADVATVFAGHVDSVGRPPASG